MNTIKSHPTRLSLQTKRKEKNEFRHDDCTPNATSKIPSAHYHPNQETIKRESPKVESQCIVMCRKMLSLLRISRENARETKDVCF